MENLEPIDKLPEDGQQLIKDIAKLLDDKLFGVLIEEFRIHYIVNSDPNNYFFNINYNDKGILQSFYWRTMKEENRMEHCKIEDILEEIRVWKRQIQLKML